MRKFTQDLVLLMQALQCLGKTSGIFNYAALGTACQYQRFSTVSQDKPAVLFFMPHLSLKLSCYCILTVLELYSL